MHKQRTVYAVWDRTTRVFHWINVICVLALALLGLAILNEKHFGVSSDGKVLLKTLHAYVGYVFALNLGWRLVWAFIGGKYARWRRLLPFGHGYLRDLRSYLRGTADFLGHNPLGRLMVSLLLLFLLTQAVTGLILAGTDLYKPPFGGVFAEWVTDGDPERLSNLKPGSTDFVVQASYDEMRNFRKPVVTIHEYMFYALMVLIFLHVLGVIIAEFRERNGLVSAMITGDKALAEAPVDAEENRE